MMPPLFCIGFARIPLTTLLGFSLTDQSPGGEPGLLPSLLEGPINIILGPRDDPWDFTLVP